MPDVSLDRLFSAVTSFHHNAQFIPTVSMRLVGKGGHEYGPTRVDRLGLQIGVLLSEHGALSPTGVDRSPTVDITAHVKSDFEDLDFDAQARLGPDGRVCLVFADRSWVSFKSLAHESQNPGEPILRPGVTFLGETERPYLTGNAIGQGGTAVVHEAHDGDRDLAAKCLSSVRFTLDDLVDRFEREARHLAETRHPNVIEYVDKAYSGENLILVMERAGETMAARAAAERPDLETALGWIEQILAGVAHIHSLGLVHRDLTPKNVMFGHDGVVKVSDFGTVRAAIDPDLTSDAANVHLGSLIYISDEQRRSPHDVVPADDVFSAGQIAYLLLTGLWPQGNPPPLATLTDAPPDATEAVETMRAYRREDRFASGGEALAALREARGGAPGR